MEEESSRQPLDLRRQILTRREALIGAGVLAGGLSLASFLAACGTTTSTNTSTGPKKGGNFRLGVTGGGAKDIIDGQNIVTKPDQARLVAGFETLLVYDENYNLTTDGLAESVTQDAPDTWTIRLKQGITFHDGKTLSADDVIYSLQRMLDPKQGLFGTGGLGSIDPNNINKMDAQPG